MRRGLSWLGFDGERGTLGVGPCMWLALNKHRYGHSYIAGVAWSFVRMWMGSCLREGGLRGCGYGGSGALCVRPRESSPMHLW